MHALTFLADWAQIDVFTYQTFALLLDRVMDAFGDIRSCATSLLEHFPRPIFNKLLHHGSSLHSNGSVYLKRADEMLRRTGRADMGDGYGRLNALIFDRVAADEDDSSGQKAILLSLLNQLESEIGIAKRDLPRAVAHAPVHGRLIALRCVRPHILRSPTHLGSRYLISYRNFYKLWFVCDKARPEAEWRQFQNRLFSCCADIWEVVKPMLCIDSPEGHEDEDEKDYDIGAKDTLSFSWRALKEARYVAYTTVVWRE